MNAKISLRVKICEGVEMVKDETRIATSNEITEVLLNFGLLQRSKRGPPKFSITIRAIRRLGQSTKDSERPSETSKPDLLSAHRDSYLERQIVDVR